MVFKTNKTNYFFLGLLLVVAILIWLAVFAQVPSHLLEVNFYDVGQGEAIFIETPNGHQVLIDGGPEATILEKLGQELPFYDRSIDLVICTHPETDHLNGLIEVLKYYQVEQILTTGFERHIPEYQEWLRIIKEKQIPVKIAQAGQVIYLGENIKMKILWPEPSLIDCLAKPPAQNFWCGGKSSNNASIVTQLIYGQREFLLTGDIERETELYLATHLSASQLESDVLKIAHHGSQTSTNQFFLQVVNPSIAIISAGRDNPYGHPHLQVLERLAGIKVYRTDEDGDIEILTDGVLIEIRTNK